MIFLFQIETQDEQVFILKMQNEKIQTDLEELQVKIK